ncbi:hypothetical protein H4R33_002954 [Dimargaris cristalligena]|nr:hypothetical protein H4R33_002954 [Dimargaris cristalligena]
MVKLQLSLKADLVNVTDLQPEDEHFDYHFKIKCNSCHEVSDNFITINRIETTPMSGSRGEANLVMKCKFCKREGSAGFESSSLKPYTAESSGQFAPIAVLECRGIEPVEFAPMAGNEVSVMDIESKITKA